MLGTKAIISPDHQHITVDLDGKWVTIPLGFDLEPWARIYLKEREAGEAGARIESTLAECCREAGTPLTVVSMADEA